MSRPITRPQFAKALLKARRDELQKALAYTDMKDIEDRIIQINQELQKIELNIRLKEQSE